MSSPEKPSAFTPINQACLAAAMGVFALLGYLWFLSDYYDPGGLYVGRDFVNVHFGGQFVASQSFDDLFNNSIYLAQLRDWLGPDYDDHLWSYPPLAFPLAEALGRLPYLAALALWTFGSMLAICLAARSTGLSWLWSIAITFSPAVILCSLLGQNGTMNSALIVFAFAAASARKPILAGLSWTILAAKPHLGLLTLPSLIGQRHFSTFIFAGIGVAFFFGFTLLRYGIAPWQQFLEVTGPQQMRAIETWEGFLQTLMPTFFMQGRMLGIGIPGAYWFHGAWAILAVVLLARAWPGQAGGLRDWLTWYVFGTFLILPYIHTYDIVALQVVLALWARDADVLFPVKTKKLQEMLWGLAWFMPFLSILSAKLWGVQPVPFLLLFMLFSFGSGHKKTNS